MTYCFFKTLMHKQKNIGVQNSWTEHNLINNRRMFNHVTDDLAEKPYIPHKSLLQWICCKCLAWWHRHSYFWPQRSCRLSKTPLRGQKRNERVDLWKKYLIKVSQQPEKPLSGSNQIWAMTSNKKDTSQQPQLSPNPRACAKRLRSPQSGIPSTL